MNSSLALSDRMLSSVRMLVLFAFGWPGTRTSRTIPRNLERDGVRSWLRTPVP